MSIVFDVGANEGQWASGLRKWGYAGMIVSFEPLEDACVALGLAARRDSSWAALNVALGAVAERRPLHVAGNSWSSSLLDMQDAHVSAAPESAYVADQDVRVSTLDEVCRGRLRPEARAYLKLDVQGFERAVLRGAQKTLEQVDGIELELSVTPLYRGQTLYREMLDFLETLGFGLVGLSEGFTDPHTGRLLQFDAVFERSGSDDRGGDS